MSFWNILVSILGALGAADIIKSIIDIKKNKKRNKEEVKNLEFENFKEQIEFLNTQITLLNQRLIEKQNEFMELDKNFTNLNQQMRDLELNLIDSEMKRNRSAKFVCYNKQCDKRITIE